METDSTSNKKKEEAWNNNPANWKLGLFYYNKEDKRILPPKRIKWLGWTVNFANPISIMIFALILFAVLILLNFLQP
jgi:uncharacterized membrane protein